MASADGAGSSTDPTSRGPVSALAIDALTSTATDLGEISDEEPKITLLAIGDYEAEGPGELSFSRHEQITYLPQRGSRRGLAIGEVDGKRGLFPLDLAEICNATAISAPPAEALPVLESRDTRDLMWRAAAQAKAGKLVGSAKKLHAEDAWLPQANGRGLRRQVWLLLNDSESCRLAGFISLWVLTLIMISTISMVLETLPAFHIDGGPELKNPTFWSTLETFVVLQFTLEYSGRLWASDAVWPFVTEPMNVIDLMAIAPWFIELFGLSNGGSAVLRVFRLARVVRVFKLGKYAAGLQMFARTLIASADALLLLVFFISMTIILASSMMYYAERGEWNQERQEWIGVDGEVSVFSSIPGTFWWCLVTLTTVGYGDVVPVSPTGRLIAVATMLGGVLVIAMPVSILGSNFQEECDKEEAAQERKAAAKAGGGRDLAQPMVQELSKLGELLAEVDSLTRRAKEKQAALTRISASEQYAN